MEDELGGKIMTRFVRIRVKIIVTNLHILIY